MARVALVSTAPRPCTCPLTMSPLKGIPSSVYADGVGVHIYSAPMLAAVVAPDGIHARSARKDLVDLYFCAKPGEPLRHSVSHAFSPEMLLSPPAWTGLTLGICTSLLSHSAISPAAGGMKLFVISRVQSPPVEEDVAHVFQLGNLDPLFGPVRLVNGAWTKDDDFFCQVCVMGGIGAKRDGDRRGTSDLG